MIDLSAYQADLNSCCQSGDSDACDTFSTGMSDSFSTNVGGFANSISSTSPWPPNPDLSSVLPFPQAIAGTTNPRNTQPADKLGIVGDTSDPWTGVQQDLNNYLTVLNQIRTLEFRAKLLNAAIGVDSFNPTNLVNLQDTLTALYTTYGNDVGDPENIQPSTMLYNLQTCLGETTTSDNVDTQCDPIIALGSAGITNAYQWYDSGNSNSETYTFLARQNTIALQYVSLFTNSDRYTWPLTSSTSSNCRHSQAIATWNQ